MKAKFFENTQPDAELNQKIEELIARLNTRFSKNGSAPPVDHSYALKAPFAFTLSEKVDALCNTPDTVITERTMAELICYSAHDLPIAKRLFDALCEHRDHHDFDQDMFVSAHYALITNVNYRGFQAWIREIIESNDLYRTLNEGQFWLISQNFKRWFTYFEQPDLTYEGFSVAEAAITLFPRLTSDFKQLRGLIVHGNAHASKTCPSEAYKEFLKAEVARLKEENHFSSPNYAKILEGIWSMTLDLNVLQNEIDIYFDPSSAIQHAPNMYPLLFELSVVLDDPQRFKVYDNLSSRFDSIHCRAVAASRAEAASRLRIPNAIGYAKRHFNAAMNIRLSPLRGPRLIEENDESAIERIMDIARKFPSEAETARDWCSEHVGRPDSANSLARQFLLWHIRLATAPDDAELPDRPDINLVNAAIEKHVTDRHPKLVYESALSKNIATRETMVSYARFLTRNHHDETDVFELAKSVWRFIAGREQDADVSSTLYDLWKTAQAHKLTSSELAIHLIRYLLKSSQSLWANEIYDTACADEETLPYIHTEVFHLATAYGYEDLAEKSARQAIDNNAPGLFSISKDASQVFVYLNCLSSDAARDLLDILMAHEGENLEKLLKFHFKNIFSYDDVVIRRNNALVRRLKSLPSYTNTLPMHSGTDDTAYRTVVNTADLPGAPQSIVDKKPTKWTPNSEKPAPTLRRRTSSKPDNEEPRAAVSLVN